MFTFLSKPLPALIYPLGLACVTLGAALVLHARRRGQSGLVAVALIVLPLVDIGSPLEALWLEPASRNTRENAIESAAMRACQEYVGMAVYGLRGWM